MPDTCTYTPESGVTLTDLDRPWIRFWNPVDPYDDGSSAVCVELGFDSRRDHLRASAHGVVIGVMGESLSPFLDGLVTDFAGWNGPRTWQTLRSDLTLTATHEGRHVTFVWELCTWHERPTPWTSTVRQTVEPGERLKNFAADMRHLLRSPATRP